MVLVWMAVVSDSAQGHTSSAYEISGRLGIPRMTVSRRLEILEKLGFVVFGGSRCHVADAMLSETQLADIESIVRRAHKPR